MATTGECAQYAAVMAETKFAAPGPVWAMQARGLPVTLAKPQAGGRGGCPWATSRRNTERWESGFDDRRRPYIVQRWPDNYVELNPVDAKVRGIDSGDTVMVYSDRVPSLKETILGVEAADYSFSGQMKAGNVELTTAAVTGVAMVTRHIKKGVIYMDFLHTSQPANALQGRVVDWVSGNYNYKMGVAKVKKIGVSPYKHTFRSMSFAPRDII